LCLRRVKNEPLDTKKGGAALAKDEGGRKRRSDWSGGRIREGKLETGDKTDEAGRFQRTSLFGPEPKKEKLEIVRQGDVGPKKSDPRVALAVLQKHGSCHITSKGPPF